MKSLICSDVAPSNQQEGHQLYYLSESQVSTGKKWSMDYGDGSADSGVEIEDDVHVGGFTTKMTLSVATACDWAGGIDGVIGVGFPYGILGT